MLIIFRGWYFVGILALGCAVFGGQELSLALKASAEPEKVSLLDLEQGRRPEQPFVEIGEYFAVYPGASYELKRERITKAMYPIVSQQHPWMVAWDELNKKYDDPATIPAGEIPAFEPVTVLALTDDFKAVSDIPDEGQLEEGAVGILFPYDELNSDERDLVALIAEDQPEQVLVIEIGRRPKSVWFGVIVCAIGLVLGLLAIRMFFRKRAMESQTEEHEEHEDDDDDERGPGGSGPPALTQKS